MLCFALLWFWLKFFNYNVFCHVIFFTLTINFKNSIHGWVNWIKCLTKALNTNEMGLTRVYIYTIIDLILTLLLRCSKNQRTDQGIKVKYLAHSNADQDFLFSILWTGDYLQTGFSQIWLKDKEKFGFLFFCFSN